MKPKETMIVLTASQKQMAARWDHSQGLKLAVVQGCANDRQRSIAVYRGVSLALVGYLYLILISMGSLKGGQKQ